MDTLILMALFSFAAFAVLFLLALGYYMVFLLVIPIIWHGAVFANSTPQIVEKMISLANISPGKKAVDLGSGDGRLVIALAKQGVEAHGYEINPFLVLLSRMNIKKAGMQGKAFIHWQSFWDKDFSGFDIVTVYGISYIMKKLEIKLKKELKPNARVISNYFVFSGWRPFSQLDNVYVYLQD